MARKEIEMEKLLSTNSFSTPIYVGMFLILTAIIGLVANLAGIWIPAIYIDFQANANNSETNVIAGADATLVAMFICSPIALVTGPISGIVGGVVSTYLAMRYKSDSTLLHWVSGSIGAGLTGFVVGVLPFAAIYLYDAIFASI